jgi:hypothetical protein
MKVKLLLGVMVFFTFVPPAIFGASLEDIVGSEQAAALRAANDLITDVQIKTPSPRFLPRHGELRRFFNETIENLDPNLLVESLFLYPKTSVPQGSTAEWSKAEQTDLFNRLAAISTLTGIQYYSASRKTMRVFYESSQVINNPEEKKPLPDPVYTELPNTLVLYARQADLTFGDNIYRFMYHADRDSVFFIQENITSMTAGIIPAIGKNKFRSLLAVIDAGDSLLIYAAGMAKTAPVPGMGDRIGASFANRAKAVLKWFVGKADEVFYLQR